MLYKKFHRNFVSQFKVGIRVRLNRDGNYYRTITTEPTIESTFATGKPFILINVTGNDNRCILVFSDGRVNDYKYLYVI